MSDQRLFQYVHIKTDGLYEVCEIVGMKDPSSRKWVQSILYRRVGGEPTVRFCREISDFHEKFKQVEQ